MNTSEQHLHLNFQFWTILGPAVLLLALVPALFLPVQQNFFFPIITCAGFLLCWKWKTGGLATSVALSLIFFSVLYSSIPQDERLWQMGVTAGIMLSFVVFTLALEEAQAIESLLQIDLASKQDEFKLLEKQLITLEIERVAENDRAQSSLAELQAQKTGFEQQQNEVKNSFDQVRAQLLSREKQMMTLKEELANSLDQKDKMMAESQLRRGDILQLQHQLQEVLAEKKHLVTSAKIHYDEMIASQMQVAELQSKMSPLHKKIEELTFMVNSTQDEARLCHQQVLAHDVELELVKSSLALAVERAAELEAKRAEAESRVTEAENKYEKALVRSSEAEKKLVGHEETIAALQEKLNTLEAAAAVSRESVPEPLYLVDVEDEQVEALQKEKHQLECLLKQLKEQFEEKGLVLSQARSELFHTKEKLCALMREKEEAEIFGNDPYINLLERRLTSALDERENSVEEVEILEQIITKLGASTN